MVMGILVLSGAYNTTELFSGKEFLRWIFGGILVVYGLFRAYNVILKLKQKPRKLRYYDDEEDDERTLL
jgi:hypothetical protein